MSIVRKIEKLTQYCLSQYVQCCVECFVLRLNFQCQHQRFSGVGFETNRLCEYLYCLNLFGFMCLRLAGLEDIHIQIYILCKAFRTRHDTKFLIFTKNWIIVQLDQVGRLELSSAIVRTEHNGAADR